MLASLIIRSHFHPLEAVPALQERCPEPLAGASRHPGVAIRPKARVRLIAQRANRQAVLQVLRSGWDSRAAYARPQRSRRSGRGSLQRRVRSGRRAGSAGRPPISAAIRTKSSPKPDSLRSRSKSCARRVQSDRSKLLSELRRLNRGGKERGSCPCLDPCHAWTPAAAFVRAGADGLRRRGSIGWPVSGL